MTTAGYVLLLFVAALALAALRQDRRTRKSWGALVDRALDAEEELEELKEKRSRAVSQGNRTRYARRRGKSAK